MIRIDKLECLEIRETYNTLDQANKALDDWFIDLEDHESYTNIHELHIDKLDNGKYFLYIRFDYIEKPTVKMGKFEDQE